MQIPRRNRLRVYRIGTMLTSNKYQVVSCTKHKHRYQTHHRIFD